MLPTGQGVSTYDFTPRNGYNNTRVLLYTGIIIVSRLEMMVLRFPSEKKFNI